MLRAGGQCGAYMYWEKVYLQTPCGQSASLPVLSHRSFQRGHRLQHPRCGGSVADWLTQQSINKGKLNIHTNHCPQRPRKCGVNGCDFQTGNKEEAFLHMIEFDGDIL